MSKFENTYLTWHGDVISNHATAQYARGILKPLIKNGASVKINNINPYNKAPANLDKWWAKTLNENNTVPPGLVQICCCDPQHGARNEVGGANILLTRWDTWKTPRSWIHPTNNLFTECWTPNEFSLSQERGDDLKIPTKVVPFGLEWTKYQKNKKRSTIIGVPSDHLILGTTAAWNNKENLSDLIIAYSTEFSSKVDKVSLVIKIDCANPNEPNEKAKIIKLVQEIKNLVTKPDLPTVVLIQDIFSQDGMNNIINAFDVYVSAARSKSKNITMLKCLAAEKSAVFINSGVHQDYYEPEYKNMYPVNFVLEPVTQMAPMYTAIDLWPRPDVAHLMYQLRCAYNNWYIPSSKEYGKITSDGLKKKYNIDTIVNNVNKYIKDLTPAYDIMNA